MHELKRERIGTALRRLAEDLVAERRRVAFLERENRELRAQVHRLLGQRQESEPRFRFENECPDESVTAQGD